MMAFSGVRSSCDMLARNCDLNRLARSASCRACSSSRMVSARRWRLEASSRNTRTLLRRTLGLNGFSR
jgi:hypothetical protein